MKISKILSIRLCIAFALLIATSSNATPPYKERKEAPKEYIYISLYETPKITYLDQALKSNTTLLPKEKSEEKSSPEELSFFATIAAAIIAAFAVIIALKQYISSLKEGRRNLAYQIYSEFLRLELENPKFAKPLDKLVLGEGSENLRYKFFVANMLFAFEQVYPVAVENNMKDWLRVMRKKIARHKLHLANSESLKVTDPSKDKSRWLYSNQDNTGDWGDDFANFVKSAIENTDWKPVNLK